MTIGASWRPNNHYHSTLEVACHDEPGLTVDKAIVLNRRDISGEYLGGIGEIYLSIPKRGRPLDGIEGDGDCEYLMT